MLVPMQVVALSRSRSKVGSGARDSTAHYPRGTEAQIRVGVSNSYERGAKLNYKSYLCALDKD